MQNNSRESLDSYIRSRSRELGLNLSQICKQAGLSRQTLYALAVESIDKNDKKLPALKTIIALADALKTHPLRLLHLVFDEFPMTTAVRQQRKDSDNSAFVRDVSYPDGEIVLSRQTFIKTWEIQNVGSIPWEGRRLQCVDEEIVVYTRSGETLALAHNLTPHVKSIPIPFAKPGATVQLSVKFTAPETSGTVLSYWKSVFDDGSICFPDSPGLWVKVRVSSMTTSAFSDKAVKN